MKQPRIRKNASAMKPAWGCPPLDAAVLPRSVVNAAAHFQTAHALADAAQLWRTLRAMDSEAVLQGARWLADQLRDAGLDNVQVIEFPADGRTSIGGWLMPIAWTVRDAVLRAAPAGRGGEVFADHAINPQSIAMYSPPTPGGGWVEGRVVAAPDVASVRRRLRGAFLLLESDAASPSRQAMAASPALNAAAAEAGALGVIVCVANENPAACRYLNYSVPVDATRPCVPCFSLAPEAGARLRKRLDANPELRLRARVRSRRATGTLPLVTATLGNGTPAVYVCAHMDEIGAQDNASGVAVALEALRALKTTSDTGAGRPCRAIRVLFSVEIRGIQAWMNAQPRPPSFFAGLNLDMVGCPTEDGGNVMTVRQGFAGVPHIAGHFLAAAADFADRQVGGMKRVSGFCDTTDACFGLAPAVGHVSLEQVPGPTYHTSTDTPDVLDAHALQWTGVAAIAFLDAARRFGNREALRMTRLLAGSMAAHGESEDAVARTAEMNSLRTAIRLPQRFALWGDARHFYAAGVRRGSGCWPEVEDARRLVTLLDDVAPPPVFLAKHRHPDAADQLVPQISFRGFLSFEDQVTPAQVRALATRAGTTPAWGLPLWASMLAARLRGKATLAEVLDELARDGVAIDPATAIAWVRHLVRIGHARLRPILEPAALHRAFRAAGVRRGSILCLHASLSAFGYVRGGADALIDAVLDVLGPSGTLCMPTHSLSVLGQEPYEPARSPSQVGAVSECFRKRTGVLRSLHPTHSVAAFGPAAETLTRLSRPDLAPMAREGFWGRLVEAEGDVLLMCPVESATIFHVGENWTGVPQPSIAAHAIDAKGRRSVYLIPNLPWHSGHFAETMARPLLRVGTMRSLPLGEGALFLASARAMAEASVAAHLANPFVSLGDGGQCACPHCRHVCEHLGATRREARTCSEK